jgi:hypothetical protein
MATATRQYEQPTRAWRPLRPHAVQRALWTTPARFVAVCAGRRSGKTELSLRHLIRMLAVPPNFGYTDLHLFYGGPTHKQAKKVAWDRLKALTPKAWLAGKNAVHESDLTIRCAFQTHSAELTIFGFDKPQRFEGPPWDGGVVDESSDIKPGTFSRSVRPALSDRRGWCWRIGVPKRFGVGGAEFRLFFDRCKASGFNGGDGLGDDGTSAFRNGAAFSWASSDILPEDEIKEVKEQLDPKDYREQYEARWETAGGQVFYAFDADCNKRSCSYDPTRPLVIGSDFNVDPMAWVVCHRTPDGKTLEVFDEVWLRDANTQRALDVLWQRYGQQHRSTFEFYGDATGQARKTAASASDYSQILNDRRFRDRGAVVRYPRSNPSVVNRFAACNALFLNAAGERRCYVDPRCTRLLDDLKVRAFKEGVREPDDYGDVGHVTDALGYVIHMLFPIRVKYEGPTPKVYHG